MKNTLFAFILSVVTISLVSCSLDMKPINYNEDQCASCKMIISDKRFGAELVTNKGKVFKYDAAECMLREVAKEGKRKYARIGITHFIDPGTLKNAEEAAYLVSENRPSPMGANLSCYASRVEAEKVSH